MTKRAQEDHSMFTKEGFYKNLYTKDEQGNEYRVLLDVDYGYRVKDATGKVMVLRYARVEVPYSKK